MVPGVVRDFSLNFGHYYCTLDTIRPVMPDEAYDSIVSHWRLFGVC